MCGIAGYVVLDGKLFKPAETILRVQNKLIAHRGPDGEGLWISKDRRVGMAHKRLAIIDLTDSAAQPMSAGNGTTISYNGEIYNYIELLKDLSAKEWRFKSRSDTECILAAYEYFGEDCVQHLRGMFSFAIWDEKRKRLFCARDRFGIKPFYYTVVDGVLYFASEAKALLPFLPSIETNAKALTEYLTFQYTINAKTLFEGIKQLMPGHVLIAGKDGLQTRRYWDVSYEIDYDHSPRYFESRLTELVEDSLKVHLRSDVPVGAYISGGIDSSLMALLANRVNADNRLGFHGRFTDYPGYDESRYARVVSDHAEIDLHVTDISATDFRRYIRDVIYHLDFPVAGPGSFPQFMVSKLAAENLKVVLGGQGGDEIFGGYARYLLAYFEQCIKAAIDGKYKNGNYVVTIESIVPNLGILREYKPLMKEFWRQGLFESLDERYFRLVDRSADIIDEIEWDALDREKLFEDFRSILNNYGNIRKEAYFDKMTHFDFKCLLPALLQVEDRMSMAHGLESRVPLLDHPIVEFAATIPADIKFEGGQMKRLLKKAFVDVLPRDVVGRRDKMGFPVPLKEWFDGELHLDLVEIFQHMKDKHRPYINAAAVLKNFGKAQRFSRKLWGFLSLELWHQIFHDRACEYRSMLDETETVMEVNKQ